MDEINLREPTIAMTIVKTILQQLPAVRQPQAKFLAVLFATILALRGHVNVRNLSRYCDYSERTLARQFRAAFDWVRFHHVTCQQVVTATDVWIAAQDASFLPKSGKRTFGLGSFFNGCASRPERGLEISSVALINVTQRYALTCAVAQTPPGSAEKTQGEASRMTFYADQAVAQRALLPQFVRYLAVDGAYSKYAYVDAVTQAGWQVITKLRSDADCYFLHTVPRQPGQKGRSRKYDGKLTGRTCGALRRSGPCLTNRIFICIRRASGIRNCSVPCGWWCWSIAKTQTNCVTLCWPRPTWSWTPARW